MDGACWRRGDLLLIGGSLAVTKAGQVEILRLRNWNILGELMAMWWSFGRRRRDSMPPTGGRRLGLPLRDRTLATHPHTVTECADHGNGMVDCLEWDKGHRVLATDGDTQSPSSCFRGGTVSVRFSWT